MLEGRCAFEQLDVGDNTEFAAWLLRIRKRLEAAQATDESGDVARS